MLPSYSSRPGILRAALAPVVFVVAASASGPVLGQPVLAQTSDDADAVEATPDVEPSGDDTDDGVEADASATDAPSEYGVAPDGLEWTSDGQLRLTPDALFERVDQHSLLLAASAAAIDRAEARRLEARYAAYPSFRVRAGLAPAPRITVGQDEDGNYVVEDDDRTELETFSQVVSVGIRMESSATIPITTFGQIRLARQLADIGIDVAELEYDKQRREDRFDAWQAHLALQWWRVIEPLLDEANQRLDEAEEELDWAIDDGDHDARGTLRELRIARPELVSLESEARNTAFLARSGLVQGLALDDAFTVQRLDDDAGGEPPSLDAVLAFARDHRPDAALLEAAVDAAELDRRRRAREYAPEIAFITSLNAAYTPTVTDLTGPFIYDPYNRFGIGFSIGLNWRINPFVQAARVRGATAELDRVSALRDAAWAGIALDVERAWRDAESARRLVLAYEDALRAAEAERNQTAFQYDQGLAEYSDFAEPLKTWYETAADYWTAVLQYRIAVARLGLACGADDLTAWPPVGE